MSLYIFLYVCLFFDSSEIDILFGLSTVQNRQESSSSIERKCPCKKKLKGEGNFPSYFDNGDVILHIFAKFQIWNWLRRNIVVRKNQLYFYCYTKLSLSRRTGNQYLSSWNNLLNNFLSGLMFQYSFLLKSITCINYLIA